MELVDFMLENGIPESVVDNFVNNKVTGECCLQLTEMEMKELAPKIADRDGDEGISTQDSRQSEVETTNSKAQRGNKYISVVSLIFHSLSHMTVLEW